jgi:hypothetical protein
VGATETAAILALTAGPTLVLLLLAVLLPHHPASDNGADDPAPPVELLSRLLFAQRSERAAIVLDCLTIPEGSPFTLELRAPRTRRGSANGSSICSPSGPRRAASSPSSCATTTARCGR